MPDEIDELKTLVVKLGERLEVVLDRLSELEKTAPQVEDDEQSEFVKLHPNSKVQIPKKQLDDLKSKSKSPSIFAIGLLPKLFRFDQLYRRTLKNQSTDKDFVKIGLDQDRL